MFWSILPILSAMQIANAQTWQQFKEIEFLFVTEPPAKTYFEAENACTALNAHLAFLKTTAVSTFVASNMMVFAEAPYDYFIGAKRLKGTGQFVWNDGTNVTNPLWASGQPDNIGGFKDCVSIGYSTKLRGLSSVLGWYAVPCPTSGRYICQRLISTTIASVSTTILTTAKAVNTMTSLTSNTVKIKTTSKSIVTPGIQVTTGLPAENQTLNLNRTRIHVLPGNSAANLTIIYIVVPCALAVIAIFLAVVWIMCRNKNNTSKSSNTTSTSVPQNNITEQPKPKAIYEIPIEAPQYDYIKTGTDANDAATYVNLQGSPDQSVYENYV